MISLRYYSVEAETRRKEEGGRGSNGATNPDLASALGEDFASSPGGGWALYIAAPTNLEAKK